jgi:hypothetical protein
MKCLFGSLAFVFLAHVALPRGAQAQAGSAYPNVDRLHVIAEGDTVRLLIKYVHSGGPAMRAPGKRLDLVYSTSIPSSDRAGRRAQADRAAQSLGGQAVELGARQLSIGICDTRACAERRDPPAEWFLYERTESGWKRVP